MKLTTPRLIIILVALVGVFAIVKLTKNNDRSSSFRTELVNFDTDLADKIVINSPEQTTNLYKLDGNWKVETVQGERSAMEGNVSSLLATLNTIEPTRLAARSESKWKDFSVDTTGTRVTVSNGGKTLTDIILGRFGVEGQRSFYTYVRLQEDEDVYVAANFMKMSVSTNTDDFRNNVVARVGKDSLTSVTFNYPDSALVLSKSADLWQVGSRNADSTAVAEYLGAVSFLSSKGFTQKVESLNPDISVTYQFTNGTEIQLSATKSSIIDWTITSSENSEEAWTDPDLFEKVFVPSSVF